VDSWEKALWNRHRTRPHCAWIPAWTPLDWRQNACARLHRRPLLRDPGADSALVIDRFDRSSSASELVLGAERGTFRVIGGAPGGDRPARIVTPSGTVDLKNGIATVEVTDRVVATFLQGDSMTVTGQGLTRTATRIVQATDDHRPSAQQSGACRCVASHRGHPYRQTQEKVGPVWRSAGCRPNVIVWNFARPGGRP
jgi:hypothetical protein